MASATVSNVIRGQSLKSHFMPIGDLRNFQTKSAVFYSNQQYIGLNGVSWMDLLDNLLILERSCSFLKKSSVSIGLNTQIGTKCNSRD